MAIEYKYIDSTEVETYLADGWSVNFCRFYQFDKICYLAWRDDEENVENITLDIAKHRNGPLKSIKLSFRGDRIKFYGRETKRGN